MSSVKTVLRVINEAKRDVSKTLKHLDTLANHPNTSAQEAAAARAAAARLRKAHGVHDHIDEPAAGASGEKKTPTWKSTGTNGEFLNTRTGFKYDPKGEHAGRPFPHPTYRGPHAELTRLKAERDAHYKKYVASGDANHPSRAKWMQAHKAYTDELQKDDRAWVHGHEAAFGK